MPEVKFAETVIEIDDEVVAKVVSFSRAVSVSEENITGSEDVIAGTSVLHEVYSPISVGETANVEGIAIETVASGLDEGQSALREAAEDGDSVVLKHTKNTGYGESMTGFFTAYSENASTSGVYKFSGTFRINSKTDITPAS